MREFIQTQELLGNQIKFGLCDSKFAICFQSTRYNGLKPHFFVYEVLKRKVVRRFYPLNKPFDLNLDDNKMSLDQSAMGFGKKDSESNLQNGDSDKEEDDYDEDVSVFEVSPKGSFLVAVVNNEFLTLKFLRQGALSWIK